MKTQRVLKENGDATSAFDSDSLDLTNYDGPWTIDVIRSASDGAPTVTIECSNDNSNWFTYKEQSGVSVTNGETFVDDEFKWRYIRVAYTSGSGTGTVDIYFWKA